MMCWSWIDSSRKREALAISCPGPGIASLRRCTTGPGQKKAKTTPCKVEWTPARSARAALRPGHVNIYPAEIENALIGMAGVRDCAVFGIPDEEFGERLCACIELEPNAALSPVAVQDFLRGRLANF